MQEPMLTAEDVSKLKAKLEAEKKPLFNFPEGPFSPLHFRTLPKLYEIICTSQEQFYQTEKLGKELKRKHRDWSDEKLMRKIFAQFPSVKIQLKKVDEQSISGAGQEDTSGDQE